MGSCGVAVGDSVIGVADSVVRLRIVKGMLQRGANENLGTVAARSGLSVLANISENE